MPLISILTPAYNVAPLLEKAVLSVAAQDIKDVEMIIVDDCSTDNTRDIIAELAAKHPFIKPLYLKENGGCSVARNAAMDSATGEWVTLLDGDDWYEPQRLTALLQAAQKYNVRVVFDNLQIYENVRKKSVDRTRFGPGLVTVEQFIKSDSPNMPFGIGFLQPMWKRDLTEKNHLRYDVPHRYGEDFVFELQLLLYAGRAYVIREAYYVYLQRLPPSAGLAEALSRAKPGKSIDIIHGCDAIIAKHGINMSEAEREALYRRRTLFKTRMRCDQFIAALRRKDYPEAVRLVFGRPQILLMNLASIRKIIRNKWHRLWV